MAVGPSTSRPWIVPGLAAFLFLAWVPPAPLHAQALNTWGPSEKPDSEFEVGGNPEAKHGSPDATGYLGTRLAPAPYLGKRVGLSGFVKTEFTDGAAALSIRVDGPDGARLARDAMYGRELRGTNDRKRCDVVVEAPPTPQASSCRCTPSEPAGPGSTA